MTAIRPRDRLSRAAAMLAVCALVAGCDTAASEAAAWDSRHAAAPGVSEEGVDEEGRWYRNTDNADGTMTIEVGPDPGVPRGWLGLAWRYDQPGSVRDGRIAGAPPYVAHVEPGSPAAAAGLARHDTILASNGRDALLGNIFPDRTPGTVYVLRVRRGGVEREARLTIGPERAWTPPTGPASVRTGESEG